VLGKVVDQLLDIGVSVAFGETTELIGAENWIVSRGRTDEIRRKIEETILAMERRAKSAGADMRGGQPTGGNIRGGLSTIEEKSLGAAIKTGTRPVDGVVGYGDRITSRGLFMVDTPGREPEFLTGIAAAGAQLMVFTTGRGAPHGFPFMPVIKLTGNPRTARNLPVHIDLDLSGMITGDLSMDVATDLLMEEINEVVGGRVTKAERLGYDESMNIYIRGPVI
jgi:altronate dehydratase large subunit